MYCNATARAKVRDPQKHPPETSWFGWRYAFAPALQLRTTAFQSSSAFKSVIAEADDVRVLGVTLHMSVPPAPPSSSAAQSENLQQQVDLGMHWVALSRVKIDLLNTGGLSHNCVCRSFAAQRPLMTHTSTYRLLLCALFQVLLSVRSAQGARQISLKKATSSPLAFGLCSSRVTVNSRISDVAQWWDSKLNGLVLVDNEVPDDLPVLPAGLHVQAVSKPWQFVSAAERCAWGQIADTHKAYPKAAWYVLGDDDTLFVPEALEALLSTYDASKPWYLGPISESPQQNDFLGGWLLSTGPHLGSYAFGGGGIIISQGLMQILIKDYEQCLHDHSGMVGGDQRIGACVKVLAPGTELTILKGMHQVDTVHHDNDPQALLEAHPVQPLLSLHHMQDVPLPGLGNLFDLRKQIRRNPYGALQQ